MPYCARTPPDVCVMMAVSFCGVFPDAFGVLHFFDRSVTQKVLILSSVLISEVLLLNP